MTFRPGPELACKRQILAFDEAAASRDAGYYSAAGTILGGGASLWERYRTRSTPPPPRSRYG
jgi:hypothetical protein